MNRISPVYIIAKKEFIDAIKNRVFLTFLIFLGILITASILVASSNFQTKIQVYQTAVAQLQLQEQSPTTLTPPLFFPLQLLRGAIEYLEIIGAILAIVLGYLSLAKERGNNTLALLMTRPVTRTQFIAGKCLGNLLLILLLTLVTFMGITASIMLVGQVSLSWDEVLKLSLSAGATMLYLSTFFALSALLTLLFKSLPNALIISFVIWLCFVLVIPQIGDTLDPDNQIPGGLFSSLHIEKPDQLVILKDFSGYEKSRDQFEKLSLTKHYERLTFAILGIKDMYNGKTVSFILQEKREDGIWVSVSALLLTFLLIITFSRKRINWKT